VYSRVAEDNVQNIDHTLPLKMILSWAVYDNARVRTEKGWEWKKIPKDPRTGENLNTNEPEMWTCSYGEAVAAFEEGYCDGIGFLLTRADDFHVTDIDDAWDHEKGNWKPEALKILKEQDTYAEESQSGEGIHAIGRGNKPNGHRKKFVLHGQSVESYDGSWHSNRKEECPRFITFTERALPGYDRPIRGVQYWVNENVPMKVSVKKNPNHNLRPTGDFGEKIPDKTVIRILEGAKRGRRFKKLFHEGDSPLWDSESTPYPSQSEADMDLAGMLAWATGRNKEQMDRLFRSSALMRDKWDEARGSVTYGEQTLDLAIDNCHSPLNVGGRSEVEDFVERCHNYRMNASWEKMDHCHLYGAFLSLGYSYGKYTEGEGMYVYAPIRNLNLRCRLVKMDAKDHARVSKTWKELRRKGLLEEIKKGGPLGSGGASLYLIHEPPPLPDYLKINYIKEHRGVSPYVVNLEGEDVEISDLNWFQKLTWTPGIKKKPRFIVEQVYYGRDTLEDLEEFFKIRKDNLKRSIKSLLEKDILFEKGGKLQISEKAIEIEFVKSGGSQVLVEYLNKISTERVEFKEGGMKANDQRSREKIKAVLRGELTPDELTAFERNLFEKHEILIEGVETVRIGKGDEKATTFAKEQGYYHPELNPDGEVA
jgi:hypothetical protein